MIHVYNLPLYTLLYIQHERTHAPAFHGYGKLMIDKCQADGVTFSGSGNIFGSLLMSIGDNAMISPRGTTY